MADFIQELEAKNGVTITINGDTVTMSKGDITNSMDLDRSRGINIYTVIDSMLKQTVGVKKTFGTMQ